MQTICCIELLQLQSMVPVHIILPSVHPIILGLHRFVKVCIYTIQVARNGLPA